MPYEITYWFLEGQEVVGVKKHNANEECATRQRTGGFCICAPLKFEAVAHLNTVRRETVGGYDIDTCLLFIAGDPWNEPVFETAIFNKSGSLIDAFRSARTYKDAVAQHETIVKQYKSLDVAEETFD